MKLVARILTFLLLLAALTPAALAQLETGAMGSRYRDDADVAADHLARGLRAKAKAGKELDAAKKAKLYDKARQELLKSVGLDASYDALLALGPDRCLANVRARLHPRWKRSVTRRLPTNRTHNRAPCGRCSSC